MSAAKQTVGNDRFHNCVQCDIVGGLIPEGERQKSSWPCRPDIQSIRESEYSAACYSKSLCCLFIFLPDTLSASLLWARSRDYRGCCCDNLALRYGILGISTSTSTFNQLLNIYKTCGVIHYHRTINMRMKKAS